MIRPWVNYAIDQLGREDFGASGTKDFPIERDLTLAEFCGVYWYVWGILYPVYPGALHEAKMLEDYARHKSANASYRAALARADKSIPFRVDAYPLPLDRVIDHTGLKLYRMACERLGIEVRT